LKTSVEKLQDIRVKLTVELSAEEVDRAIADAYADAAAHVRVPGFRSGRAPREVIDTYVGREAVLAQALEGLVESKYPLALDAERLRPIERPDVGTLDGLTPGQPYSFVAEMDVRPELTLSSSEGIIIFVPPAVASDREVDAQIDYLRDRFASLEPVEDRGVAADDFALISFVGTVDGDPYDGNVVDKFLYEMNRGQMPAEFESAMLGAKPGETVRAEFPVPETSANQDFVGRTAAFDIAVHEIKAKRLPELDDELAGNIGGFDTMAELRADIREKLDEKTSRPPTSRPSRPRHAEHSPPAWKAMCPRRWSTVARMSSRMTSSRPCRGAATPSRTTWRPPVSTSRRSALT
jgi:trigger factor